MNAINKAAKAALNAQLWYCESGRTPTAALRRRFAKRSARRAARRLAAADVRDRAADPLFPAN